MSSTNETTGLETLASREALELDRRTETLLDELVALTSTPELPADFPARIMAARPFAPWEVRRFSSWRVPFAVGGALVAGSAGLFLAPLWRLGPGTALAFWGKLGAAALASPISSIAAAAPLLAEGFSRMPAGLSAPSLLLFGAGTLLAAGALVFGLRRPAAVSAARDRAI